MKPNTRLDAFELGAAIGEGGMSEVFVGRHVISSEKVAIKVTQSTDDTFRRAFAAEIAAMARMHHSSIVRIHDWGALPDGSGNWCAMDWAPHGALDAAQINNWYDLREMLVQVLNALAHAHARDVIHRDLKPQNVLVFDGERNARYRLADFGLAHSVIHHDKRSTGMTAGTPSYMAPEQLHGRWREFGPWTDLYALGCMAFELACGRPPFTGSSPVAVAIAHIRDPRPELKPRFDVPEGFDAWIARLLCRDWTRRPRNATAARHALEILPDPTTGSQTFGADFADALTFIFDRTALAKTLIEQGVTPDTALENDDEGGEFPEVPVPSEWRSDEATSTAQFGDAGSRLLGFKETALIGHEEARDQLWAELLRVVNDGAPRVVLLEGHSHESAKLVEWMVRRVREITTIQTVVFDASLEKVDRDPFHESLGSMLNTSNLGDERLPEQIDRMVRHHLGGDDTLRRHVLEVFASSTSRVVRRLAARATFWEMLLEIAKRRPVLVVMSEIARDPAEWFLIERIAYGSSAPILVVATPIAPTWQPSESERRLRQDPDTVVLEPDRLTIDEATYILDSYIRLVPDLRAAWGEIAVRDLSLAFDLVIDGASLGALKPTESGYRLIDGLEMPTTVEQAASLRMIALRHRYPDAARALTVAALLGRYVETGPWQAAMKQLGVNLASASVETLMRHRLLRRVHDSYRFATEADRVAILSHLSHDDARGLLKTLPSGVRWDLARATVHLLLGDPESAAQTLLGVELVSLRSSTTFADRWLAMSRVVTALLPDHALSTRIRVVATRCIRGKNPKLRAEFAIKNMNELADSADADSKNELKTEIAISFCHLGRIEEAEKMIDSLLEDPTLSERLRAEVLAAAGWIKLLDGPNEQADRMLGEAVEFAARLKNYGAAASAAQYHASATTDFEKVDARFERGLHFASLAQDLSKYVPVLLERSMDHLFNERYSSGIEIDSEIAYRLGPWGTPLMRIAFGANRAICLASIGEHEAAKNVLEHTGVLLHPDDRAGRTQLHATRCLLAAIEGDPDEWDAFTAQKIAPPIPELFKLLATRHWKKHGDEIRAAQSLVYFDS